MSGYVYLVLTVGLYAVGAAHVIVHAVTRRRLLSWATMTATLLGFAFHTASLGQRWTEAGHFPVVGLHDGASFLAWGIVLVYLAAYLRTRLEALGLLVHPVAFGLVLLAAFTRPPGPAPTVLTGVFLPIHATLAFVGYGALFLAFALGVLYLVQERELKARVPRTFYYLAPSLETCDSLGGDSAVVGFAFLTLTILTGALWSHNVHHRYWVGDPKEWSAVVAWFIYVALIVARFRSGWGGRRAAWLGIAGFGTVVFTFVWVAVLAAPR